MLAIMPSGFFEIVWFLIQEEYPLYLSGIRFTIVIAVVGTFLGLLVAFLLSVLRLGDRDPRDAKISIVLKRIGNIVGLSYVEFFRGTPMIVQAMIFYYGLAMLGLRLELMLAGIIVVTLNTAAYLSEVLRAGINSIDPGQMEAARSIGMTKGQGYIHVIFPQVVRNMVPAIGNELVINIKDTAVLSVIGVGELFYMGRSVAGTYYRYTESFVIVAFIYLIIVLITTRILNAVVARMNRNTTTNLPDNQLDTGATL
ncbi:amino acid ABC transporter permease [Candidatus Xianfuyuplasma coldseepsis]|uniref:Amino acid ABC transporter permease n=1 Tax=Candidatus Xianfuyuplasma coldseepsis TaxID=2782163 RepID=A0A7L7KRL5_9MOLU|nr:amino acid ABC transporter permease [Xianfuyuplasma coldseepsis]QMS85470.1 amino acid ABC transporter permease [Xianfuyuplasma coldseepsis]